jgi:Resolvase, N terminal domain/Homeodomain-like domain
VQAVIDRIAANADELARARRARDLDTTTLLPDRRAERRRRLEPDLEFRAFCARRGLHASSPPALERAWDLASRAIPTRRDRPAAELHRQPVPATLTTRPPARVQETGHCGGAHGLIVTGTPMRSTVSWETPIQDASSAWLSHIEVRFTPVTGCSWRGPGLLVVWKLDRLGRSVKDVLTIADDLHARGIGVKILTGKLSGSYSPTGEGKFFFTMMAAFAELERDIIHERTIAGLVAARAQGRNGGGPTVMDEDKLAAARARRARGESPTAIAKALGVSRASVYRHLGTESQEA